MFYIFDLDGTVICSKHRHATLENGDLDLEHWVANSTPDKVAQDDLLPCADTWRDAVKAGHTIVVLTARVMMGPDYQFLHDNGLHFDYMLSRPNGCTMSDAELKDIQLRIFAQNRGISFAFFASKAIVIDDNQAVLTRLKSIGFDFCIDANKWNQSLREQLTA